MERTHKLTTIIAKFAEYDLDNFPAQTIITIIDGIARISDRAVKKWRTVRITCADNADMYMRSETSTLGSNKFQSQMHLCSYSLLNQKKTKVTTIRQHVFSVGMKETH